MEETSRKLALRTIAGLLFLFMSIAICGTLLRPKLEYLGNEMISRLGSPGMALGAFLADGVHFPVPPQFYLFATIASHRNDLPPVLAVCIGSILGGVVAFLLGQQFAKVQAIQEFLAPSRVKVETLFR